MANAATAAIAVGAPDARGQNASAITIGTPMVNVATTTDTATDGCDMWKPGCVHTTNGEIHCTTKLAKQAASDSASTAGATRGNRESLGKTSGACTAERIGATTR